MKYISLFLLLTISAPVMAMESPDLLEEIKNNPLALHDAVKANDIDKAGALLQAGADKDAKDKRGYLHWTPLHKAAIHGNTEIVQLLIKNGADLHTQGFKGKTALHLALERGLAEIVSLLLAAGADVNTKDNHNNTPLHMATKKGRVDIAHLLIKNNAKVDAKNHLSSTPLHYAAKWGEAKVAELLINNGAKLKAKNGAGKTPLHSAAYFGRTEVVQLLLDNGADVNALDEEGWTPLHLAALSGRAEVAQQLINAGADVNALDDEGCTPLHFAANRGNVMVAKILIERGADYNAQNMCGNTPIHEAISSLYIEIVSLEKAKMIALLLVFCDPTIKNEDGKIAKETLRPNLEKLYIKLPDEKEILQLASDEIDKLHLLFDGKILNKFKECFAIHKRRLPMHKGRNLTTAVYDYQINGPAPINGPYFMRSKKHIEAATMPPSKFNG